MRFLVLCCRNIRLERADFRSQALVLLPDGHAEGPDQGEDERRRETDGRGHHLVQDHLPEDSEARLAGKVQAGEPGGSTVNLELGNNCPGRGQNLGSLGSRLSF